MKRKYSIAISIFLVLFVVLLVMVYRYSYLKALDKISESEVENTETELCYYIKNTDGYVTVYESDGQTVYEYTSILVEELPEKIKTQLQTGIKVSTPSQVYGFLENYSS